MAKPTNKLLRKIKIYILFKSKFSRLLPWGKPMFQAIFHYEEISQVTDLKQPRNPRTMDEILLFSSRIKGAANFALISLLSRCLNLKGKMNYKCLSATFLATKWKLKGHVFKQELMVSFAHLCGKQLSHAGGTLPTSAPFIELSCKLKFHCNVFRTSWSKETVRNPL